MEDKNKETEYYVLDERTGEYKLIGQMIDVVKWADKNDDHVQTVDMREMLEKSGGLPEGFGEEQVTFGDKFMLMLPLNTVIAGWAVLGILKLTGVIEIGWQWVMCPVWLPVFSSLLIYGVMLIWAVITGFIDGAKESDDDV